MKKICFFIGDISKSGGTERVSLLIANYLCNIGYEISILSYSNGDSSEFFCDSRIKLHSLHQEKKVGFFERKISPYCSLYKFLKNEKPDILINVDVILCMYSLPLKFFSGTKMIAWEHFNYRETNGVKNRMYARKIAAKIADCIIVLTEADKKEYKKNIKLHAPIKVIYNPSVKEGTIKKSSEKENWIIASGRLTYQKNFGELIEIWNFIEHYARDWKLIICGNGEEERELKEKILQYNLKNIIMPGFCKNIQEYYEKSQVMVMTSRFEGFPMVLLEAQKNGLPIVAYDCFTGPSEIIIDGRNGYLIKYGSKEEFSHKLLELIKNEKLRTEMGINAYEDSNRFSIEYIASEWNEILKKL